jgi:hemolysin activation/secretion protein
MSLKSIKSWQALNSAATVALSLSGDAALFGGRLRENISVTHGLGIFGATLPGDPLASRDDADGRFVLANAYIDWTGALAGPLSLKLAGTAQIASGPLLSVSEMGLGGNRFGRAYGYSERSGDEGIAGSAELRTDFNKPFALVDWVQLYTFADGGAVRNLGNGLGGGTLYSGGAGVRLRAGKVNLGVESAFPLNAVRFDSGDRDPRFNMQLSLGF